MRSKGIMRLGRTAIGTILWLAVVAGCRTAPPADTYVGPAEAPAPSVAGIPAPAAPPMAPRVAETGPLALSVEEAIVLCLERNRGLGVQRMEPKLSRTSEQEERAIYDATLGASAEIGRSETERLARAGSGTETTIADTHAESVTLSQELPTGTTAELTARGTATDSSLYNKPFSSARAGLTVTQSLLRGFGIRANLAAIGQARLDTRISEYELRGYAEALVAEVEKTYWDVVLARRRIDIYVDSVALAQQQLDETRESIRLGRLSEIELSASQAELALRQEDLINAQSRLDTALLKLRQLLNPPGETAWERDLQLLGEPVVPAEPLGAVGEHVALARRMRPELNQARLQVESDELQIVRTRNGLLPKLDLFATLGGTGYADNVEEAAREIDGNFYDYTLGVRFEMPLGNRAARARHDRALLSREQSEEALGNLADLVELDVRSAYIEVNRARQQIAATTATRRFQEAKYQAELDKFHVGRSTSLLVAQAQRDLISSRLAEVESAVGTLKALTDLYRFEGSLLVRRGIAAPGIVLP